MNPQGSSIKIYACIVAVLVILLVVMLLQGINASIPEIQRSQLSAAALMVVVLLGAIGIFFMDRTGFPSAWDSRIAIRYRLYIPILLGGILGVVFALLRFAGILPLSEGPTFPASIPYFIYGGLVSEIILRLFTMPIIIWLVSTVLLGGKAQEPVSWFATLLSSVLEPLGQLGAMSLLGISDPILIISIFLLIFLANIIMGRLFRRYGFGASVAMRLGFYLLWHIV